MAYNKIWTIKNNVGGSKRYIEDQNKTDALKYISDDGKTTYGHKIMVTGLLCNPNSAVTEFKMREEAYHDVKTENIAKGIKPNQAIHVIQSFSAEDSKNMTPEELHEMGVEYAKRISGGHFQCVIASHLNNPDQLHNHLLFNAYAYDGIYKFIEDREALKRIREINNELCEERGYEVIVPKGLEKVANYKEWEEKQNGTSWKDQVRQDITSTMQVSNTWYDFKMYLEKAGYEIKENKNSISYKAPGNPCFVTDKKLGKKYERAALLEYWHQEKEMPQVSIPEQEKEEAPKNNAPDFKVEEYDIWGKKRSPIELLLLTTVKKLKYIEMYEPEQKQDNVIDNPINARVDYKLQNMLDTLALARENNIQTQEDLENKIKEIATGRNNLKVKLDGDSIQIQNMENTVSDINDFLELEEIVDNIEIDSNLLNLPMPDIATVREAKAKEDPMTKKQKMDLFKLMETETEYKLDVKFSQITRTEATPIISFLKDKTQPKPELLITVAEFERKREEAKDNKIAENKQTNLYAKFEKIPASPKEKIQVQNLLKKHPEIQLKHEVKTKKDAMEILDFFNKGGAYPEIFVSEKDVEISKLSLDEQITVKSYLDMKQNLYNLGLTDTNKIQTYKEDLKNKVNTFAEEKEIFIALGKEYGKLKRMEYNIELAKNSAYTQPRGEAMVTVEKPPVKEADIDKEVEQIRKNNKHDNERGELTLDYRTEDKHFHLDEER